MGAGSPMCDLLVVRGGGGEGAVTTYHLLGGALLSWSWTESTRFFGVRTLFRADRPVSIPQPPPPPLRTPPPCAAPPPLHSPPPPPAQPPRVLVSCDEMTGVRFLRPPLKVIRPGQYASSPSYRQCLLQASSCSRRSVYTHSPTGASSGNLVARRCKRAPNCCGLNDSPCKCFCRGPIDGSESLNTKRGGL